jgi:hypothetical protein
LQTDYPVRERIFLLLDATQTAVGGAKGKFPEFYAAYYDLVVILFFYLFAFFPRTVVNE